MLSLQPIAFKDACAFIARLHRHHKPPQGCKFSISALDDTTKIVGVAIVGRPISRMLDDGYTAEVTRLCSDGTPNVCSLLYGAAARAAKAMGYCLIITYILDDETGTSLRAAGYQQDRKKSAGGSWSRDDRQRNDKHPLQPKTRWSRVLGEIPAFGVFA